MTAPRFEMWTDLFSGAWPGPTRLLASTEPGLAGWRSVVAEFHKTLSHPLEGWPVLAAIVGGALLIWLNIRMARRLIGVAEHEIELHAHRNG